MLTPPSDAIIALGAGLNKNGKLAPANYARLDRAVQLFQACNGRNLVLSGGWSFLAPRPQYAEACQMFDYVQRQGLDEDSLFIEANSHDTIGNAVFCKQLLAVPNGWRNVEIVTSQTHARRAEKVFRHVFGKEFFIKSSPASEQRSIKARVWEPLGNRMMDYVLDGTEPGDDAAIYERLVNNVPQYGGNATLGRLALNTAFKVSLDFFAPARSTAPTIL